MLRAAVTVLVLVVVVFATGTAPGSSGGSGPDSKEKREALRQVAGGQNGQLATELVSHIVKNHLSTCYLVLLTPGHDSSVLHYLIRSDTLHFKN